MRFPVPIGPSKRPSATPAAARWFSKLPPGHMVQLTRPRSRALRASAELDHVDLRESDDFLKIGRPDEDIPVIAGAVANVGARPAIAVLVDPGWLRFDRAMRHCGAFPPVVRRTERIACTIRRGGQAPIKASGPADIKIARVVDAQDLSMTNRLGLDMKHPASGHIHGAAASGIGGEVTTRDTTRKHHDVWVRSHCSDRCASHLVFPRNAERLLSEQLREPRPPSLPLTGRESRHVPC